MEKKAKNRKIFFLLSLLAILIILFDHFRTFSTVKGFLERSLVIPVRSFLRGGPQAGSVSQNGDFSGDCRDKDQEILKLAAEIASLKEENLASRKLLGSPLPPNWQYLPARVIGGLNQEIIIDKGSNQGIILEMPAVAEGIFFGRVNNVSENMARISPVYSSDFRQVVKIISKESGVMSGKGLLSGRGWQKMTIEEILAENEIKEGDLVVFSLWEGDLPIGRITRVNYQKGDVFKSAEVESELVPDNLQTIFLITGKI